MKKSVKKMSLLSNEDKKTKARGQISAKSILNFWFIFDKKCVIQKSIQIFKKHTYQKALPQKC